MTPACTTPPRHDVVPAPGAQARTAASVRGTPVFAASRGLLVSTVVQAKIAAAQKEAAAKAKAKKDAMAKKGPE